MGVHAEVASRSVVELEAERGEMTKSRSVRLLKIALDEVAAK
jgi:hypothetical protein